MERKAKTDDLIRQLPYSRRGGGSACTPVRQGA
jgi:hypothetical protein